MGQPAGHGEGGADHRASRDDLGRKGVAPLGEAVMAGLAPGHRPARHGTGIARGAR